MAGGLDPATPVAAVGWGTRPEQTSVRVRLDQLGAAALEPPVTIVVGPVAGLDLGWYERRPLFGRRIVVTRPPDQSSVLSRRLQDLGARVVELPTIRIEAPADGGAGLDRAAAAVAGGGYEWIVFTSAHAVEALLARIPDVRQLAGVMVAAGWGRPPPRPCPGTGSSPTWSRTAGGQDAAGLVELLPAPDPDPDRPGRVLFPRAAEGRPTLVEGLTARGWEVDLVEAYRTVRAEILPGAAIEVAEADAICFSSSSTVTGFLEGCGPEAVPPVVVCIGPATAATARAAGLDVAAVAEESSIDGLVDAVVRTLERPG